MVTRPLPLDERDETLSLPVIAERAPSMREVTLCSIKRAEASGHVKETSIFRSTGEGVYCTLSIGSIATPITASAAMMSVLNEIYDKGSVTRGELMTFITLLNPFAPHLTEEINEVLGNREMLARAKWPEYDPAKCVDAAVEIAVQVSGKIKARLMIPTDSIEEAVKALVMADANVQAALAGKTVIKEIYVKGKLYNIVAK